MSNTMHNISDLPKEYAILIVLHKRYQLPNLPFVYKPIQVGFQPTIDPLFFRDNTGQNISEKNATFCELTALFWAWKNLDADILGLCHYRRFLGFRKDRILEEKQIDLLLKKHDIILPMKRHYWIETRGSQYAHAHHVEDLQVTETILNEKYPKYLPAWKHMLASRSGQICNMFIIRRELLDEYCAWLFDILFEAEERLDISSYSDNDKRVFGFLGERLLDVWVETKGLSYVEVPVISLEKQHWIRKGFSFIHRKIIGELHRWI